MPTSLLLPLANYQRIYQVIYSVLESTGRARTHRACLFFAAAATFILRNQYKLPATISAGTLALMVDEPKSRVLFYGRKEAGEIVHDSKAFHVWVECDGWVLDFMAPIMGEAVREDGFDWQIPRHMFQKPLADRKSDIDEIEKAGEFYLQHDSKLVEQLLDGLSVETNDLLNVCLAWHTLPPAPLKDIAMAGSHGEVVRLVAHAPSITGVW